VQQQTYISIAGRRTSSRGWRADHPIDYKEMHMKDYDYVDIEACIAEARRLRSEALAEHLALAWKALKNAFAGTAKPKDGRRGPYLPA
jgi:hypothetical protein